MPGTLEPDGRPEAVSGAFGPTPSPSPSIALLIVAVVGFPGVHVGMGDNLRDLDRTASLRAEPTKAAVKCRCPGRSS